MCRSKRRHEFSRRLSWCGLCCVYFQSSLVYAEKGREQNNNVYMPKYASIQFIQTVTTCNHRLIICCFIFYRALDSIMFIAPEWLSDPTVCLTFLCHFTTLPSLQGSLGSIVSQSTSLAEQPWQITMETDSRTFTSQFFTTKVCCIKTMVSISVCTSLQKWPRCSDKDTNHQFDIINTICYKRRTTIPRFF